MTGSLILFTHQLCSRHRLVTTGQCTFPAPSVSTSTLAICTKPLARQGVLLWLLDRVLDTEGGVHDTVTPTHAGGSPATELLRTHSSPLHTHGCRVRNLLPQVARSARS